MTNRFRLSTMLTRLLEDRGISLPAVLRQAGLPMGILNQEKVLLTTEEFFALYRGIAEATSDPTIGLKLGTEDRMERYDPIAIAAVCTRSFGDAIGRISRYKQLTCPEKIDLAERGSESAVHFTWLLAEEEEPAMLIDVCFAWMLSIARRGTGQPIHPKRVEFQRPEAHRAVYEKHFQCPVKFKAAKNVLVFDKSDMDAAFLTYNADLLAAVAPQLEAELKQQLTEGSLREQVKATLKRLLAGERPAIEHVARELHLSKRTLQRRLTEDGITFQQLMEEARRELAQHYLLHSSLELNETAYLLGYEDANSFFRAFHEWEGTTPRAVADPARGFRLANLRYQGASQYWERR
jgi:AraC-like DNA-binding protein